jgi:hypothetical protein
VVLLHDDLSILPCTYNTLPNQRGIRPFATALRWGLSKLIRSIKASCRPGSVSKVDIRVGTRTVSKHPSSGRHWYILQELKLLAQVLLTALSVSSTGLSQHSLPVVLLEPSSERLERGVNVVLHALRVRSGVVTVQVLVHVHDEVVGGAIGVLDLCQSCCGAGRDERLCACEALAGHQNHVVLGTSSTDGSHDGLDGIGPLADVGDVLNSGFSI